MGTNLDGRVWVWVAGIVVWRRGLPYYEVNTGEVIQEETRLAGDRVPHRIGIRSIRWFQGG